MTDEEIDPSTLVLLTIEDGIRLKWEAGRQKYGETWGGGPPMDEGYSELLDYFNYLWEARERGEITFATYVRLRHKAEELAFDHKQVCRALSQARALTAGKQAPE